MNTERAQHDSGSSRVEVEAIVATSHPVAAYGGIQLDESVLNDIAAAIRSGSLPMLTGHDIRRPLNANVLDVQVRKRPDRHKEVWVRFSVDADAWAQYEREREASGAPGGFSIAFSEPIVDVPAIVNEQAVHVALEADAAHWSDEDLIGAAENLRVIGHVHLGRRYQLAAEPLAVVVLTIGLAPIVTGLITNALYDALKRFLRPARHTVFHFHIEREGGGNVNARLETDDPKVLRHAIDAFEQLADPGRLNEWNESERTWTPEGNWTPPA